MGAYSSLATMGLNLALSRQSQRQEGKQLDSDRDRQVRDILARDAEARRQQDQALRRRLAEERARAGAAGTGGSGGSADAILRGLEEESRAVRNAQEDTAERQIDTIRDRYAGRQRSNLLELSNRWLSGSGLLGGGSRSRSLHD